MNQIVAEPFDFEAANRRYLNGLLTNDRQQ